MDIAPISEFTYDNETAWQDFLLFNSLSHDNYNSALALLGVEIPAYPILDIGDTKEAKQDWLQTHYQMHQNLADALNLIDLPDLSDVELHSADEFYNWLQLHAQQHQLIDAALGL